MSMESVPLLCQPCGGWVVHDVAAVGDGVALRCTRCGATTSHATPPLLAELVDRLWTAAIRASVRQAALRPPCRAGVVLVRG